MVGLAYPLAGVAAGPAVLCLPVPAGDRLHLLVCMDGFSLPKLPRAAAPPAGGAWRHLPPGALNLRGKPYRLLLEMGNHQVADSTPAQGRFRTELPMNAINTEGLPRSIRTRKPTCGHRGKDLVGTVEHIICVRLFLHENRCPKQEMTDVLEEFIRQAPPPFSVHFWFPLARRC